MKTKRRINSAFTLVEVSIAMGVAAFCLVSIMGLLPVGISSNQTSIQQTCAVNLAAALLSDLRATQNNVPASATSTQYQIPIPASGAASSPVSIFLRGDGSVAQNGALVNVNADSSQNPLFRATITFSQPAAGQRTATQARIFITWPALADPKAASAPSKFSGSYEILSSLDRN